MRHSKPPRFLSAEPFFKGRTLKHAFWATFTFSIVYLVLL